MEAASRPFTGFELAVSAYAATGGTGFEVMGTAAISTLSIAVVLSGAVGWHINQKLKRASSGVV